jgi:hypothetical protein
MMVKGVGIGIRGRGGGCIAVHNKAGYKQSICAGAATVRVAMAGKKDYGAKSSVFISCSGGALIAAAVH